MDVHVGGPVETGRGFVLHSSDYYAAELDAGDRRRRVPDGHHRHSQGDRRRQGARAGRSWRSATPAGARASSRARSRPTAGCIARPTSSCCSTRPRAQVRARAVQDRHRSLPSRQRRRSRLSGAARLPRRRGGRRSGVSLRAAVGRCRRLGVAGGAWPAPEPLAGSAGELRQACRDRGGRIEKLAACGRWPGAAAMRCAAAWAAPAAAAVGPGGGLAGGGLGLPAQRRRPAWRPARPSAGAGRGGRPVPWPAASGLVRPAAWPARCGVGEGGRSCSGTACEADLAAREAGSRGRALAAAGAAAPAAVPAAPPAVGHRLRRAAGWATARLRRRSRWHRCRRALSRRIGARARLGRWRRIAPAPGASAALPAGASACARHPPPRLFCCRLGALAQQRCAGFMRRSAWRTTLQQLQHLALGHRLAVVEALRHTRSRSSAGSRRRPRVSTPSATTFLPSSCASATTERRMTEPVPFSPLACRNERSILMVSKVNWLR